MGSGDAAVEGYKKAAAERALQLVSPGMLLGLGTGSTAGYFIQGLGSLVRDGLEVRAVATSLESEKMAEASRIKLVHFTDRPIDLAVDGADQIDPERNCLKGRGGAMLREKIVARSSRRFVLIADQAKLVDGLHGPVPVEVLPFLWEATARSLTEIGGSAAQRVTGNRPFVTDNGNIVLDVAFPSLENPADLAARIQAIPGVLGHGLFLQMASAAIVAGPSGIRILGTLA
jgi:ribose 5-phosphate isomerase A